MNVSQKWLQKYFQDSPPETEDIADALTFHAFEIEGIEGDVLDVKVLPDRAAYGLSHRGVARELATAADLELTKDPLRESIPEYPSTDLLQVSVEDTEKCTRYMGALIKGVKVGPSPAWLKEALESVGQRSVNNIVDATNYVMLDIGQPLHAFDAAKLVAREGMYSIRVRSAVEDELVTSLSGDEYTLPEGVLLITDANASEEGLPIGIAGIKGGAAAAITESTTDIIIESANFDGTLVRRAAKALKLFTDASTRFQNRPSPILASYGMRDVIMLIQDIAGGELIGVTDAYAAQPEAAPVSLSLPQLNGVLGTALTSEEVSRALDRLGFSYTESEQLFTILPPFERRDMQIPEDLVEEVGRTIGYDMVPSTELPVTEAEPDQARFRGIECIKDFLLERGWSEISTPSFAVEGDVYLANPLDQTKPALRASLLSNMEDALTKAVAVAPRVLGPTGMVKLFEIGTVFTKSDEVLLVSLGYKPLTEKFSIEVIKEAVAALDQEIFMAPSAARYSLDGGMVEINLSKLNLEKTGEAYAPVSVRLGRYTPYSVYPFALRDIAVWTPEGTKESDIAELIQQEAGELLARVDLFDQFEKDTDGTTRTSYAFRLVFESKERTLADTDLDPLMARITDALNAQEGFQVR